ncbi:MAG: redoxin domain-containing protein [Thalassovita sp.]
MPFELGAQVPDFRAETTRGTLSFRPWAAGKWVYVFGFPSTFASVCSTELIAFAAKREECEKIGLKLLGITPSGLRELHDWVSDLERLFGLDVFFPIIADEKCKILRHLGMSGAEDSMKLNSRPGMFIDPAYELRMFTNYPARMGRSTDEVIRCVEGMKDMDYSGLAIPADWGPGDDLVAPKGVATEELQQVFGDDWSKISDYLLVAHVKG